jgi:hypothetical protein
MNFEFNTLTLLILFGIAAVGLLFCHSRISEASREIRETSVRIQENLERRILETSDRFSAETRGLRDSVMSINERITRIQDEVNDTLEEARKRIVQEAESDKEDQEKRLSFFGNLVESTRKELLAGLEEKSRLSAEQNEKALESLRPLASEVNHLAGITRNLPPDTGERLQVLEKIFQEQVARLALVEESVLVTATRSTGFPPTSLPSSGPWSGTSGATSRIASMNSTSRWGELCKNRTTWKGKSRLSPRRCAIRFGKTSRPPRAACSP